MRLHLNEYFSKAGTLQSYVYNCVHGSCRLICERDDCVTMLAGIMLWTSGTRQHLSCLSECYQQPREEGQSNSSYACRVIVVRTHIFQHICLYIHTCMYACMYAFIPIHMQYVSMLAHMPCARLESVITWSRVWRTVL